MSLRNFFIRNFEFEFFEKNFHPSIQHNGGREMGVKDSKILTPKSVFHPKSIIVSHVVRQYKPHSTTECWLLRMHYNPHFPIGCHRAPHHEIIFLEIFLHPCNEHNEGMFLEVKNFKNPNPKVILDPNAIFKNHHFVVMFRWVEETGP